MGQAEHPQGEIACSRSYASADSLLGGCFGLLVGMHVAWKGVLL